MVRKLTEQHLSLKNEEAKKEGFRLLGPRVRQSFDPRMPSCGAAIFVGETSSELVILSYVRLSLLAFANEGASKNC